MGSAMAKRFIMEVSDHYMNFWSTVAGLDQRFEKLVDVFNVTYELGSGFKQVAPEEVEADDGGTNDAFYVIGYR